MVLFLLSETFLDLILCEIFSSIAFALKGVSDLNLIHESIPESDKKGSIFAKITGKSLSNYYYLNAISLIISGFLFSLNGYLPIIISLVIVTVSTIMSLNFIEPTNEHKDKKVKESLKESKKAFKFILHSKRLRSLLIFSSLMSSFIVILTNYQVNILEELKFSSIIIGLFFATLDYLGGLFLSEHENFHNLLKNKSLAFIGIVSSIICLIIGITTHFIKERGIILFIVFIALMVKYILSGIYQILIDRYYGNFTNEKIDTKVFSTKLFIESIVNLIFGLFASLLLTKMSTGDAFIVLGITFLILFTFAILYMKSHLGLKPKEYPKGELFTYKKKKENINNI